MQFKDILLERRGRIVCVTLNRPDRMNAIGVETSAELLQAFKEYRDDPEQWVMILTGAGDKAFCSGMFVTEAAQKTQQKGRTEGYTIFKPWTDMMQSIRKPFICAVNGYCVGGGWHLVADSDIIIASENAQFLDTHVNIGLINGVEFGRLGLQDAIGNRDAHGRRRSPLSSECPAGLSVGPGL